MARKVPLRDTLQYISRCADSDDANGGVPHHNPQSYLQRTPPLDLPDSSLPAERLPQLPPRFPVLLLAKGRVQELFSV